MAAPDRMPTRVPDIRKGDTVIVLAGKDAGKRGTVERVMRRRGTTYGRRKLPDRRGVGAVAAARRGRRLNIAKRHTKPRQRAARPTGVPQIQQGGILDIAQPLPISKVMLVCPRCESPRASGTAARGAASASGLPPLRRAARGDGDDEPAAMSATASEVVPALCKEFELRRTRCRCRGSTKIVVNIGLGEALTNAKALDAAVGDLATITGQKPVVTRARRSIAQFRLRTGNPIGAKVTLRGQHMWDFLERLTTLALPRIRDFRGVPAQVVRRPRQLLARAARAARVPEIDYDKVDRLRGLEVSIVTTAKTDEESKRLLELLGMPFAGVGAGGDRMAKKSTDRQGEAQAASSRSAATTAASSAAGRARYMRRFALCRICFRERALLGELPGVTKSSW